MPSLSRRQTFAAAAVLAAAVPSFAMAQEAAKSAAGTPAYRELIWGDPKAKVTMIEYASLSCHHCANFANDVLPELKKAYVDTGKVRLVYRDFPTNNLAMAGAMLARCAPEDRGKKLIEVMFKNQEAWTSAQQPIEPLKGYAALAGMSAADVEACLANKALLTAIQEEQNKASSQYRVEATPTFFINDEKVEGLHQEPPGKYDPKLVIQTFSKIIDKHLQKAK